MVGLFQISEPTQDAADVLSYEICGRDRIVAFGQGWPEKTYQKSVLSRSLWDVVDDANISDIYRALVTEIRRTGLGVCFAFRCDDPGTKRLMSMVMMPLGCGGIRFSSRLIATEPQEVGEFHQRHLRLPVNVDLCPECGRIKIGDQWQPASEALDRLGIFADDIPFRTHQVRCPPCCGTSH
ncbi:hypothetical protein CCC_02193 [Paramagnetospirillum magnetotacticum MS-1]|uniref:Uncharacterized protein n=1 Tax=Paramagnetospirillum magnetotacticum MS-1 TaxID=272627 RepID=A0A0C2YUE2_PARME|nr:hypothetical protein [Paramagnetospirillum magnetotacticum]KIL98743.1 hypothetical protein CCC_02193 [Paramagnetospirillum magnetotacticum MS-1]